MKNRCKKKKKKGQRTGISQAQDNWYGDINTLYLGQTSLIDYKMCPTGPGHGSALPCSHHQATRFHTSVALSSPWGWQVDISLNLGAY